MFYFILIGLIGTTQSQNSRNISPIVVTPYPEHFATPRIINENSGAFVPPSIDYRLLKRESPIFFHGELPHQADPHLSPISASVVRIHDHGYRKPPQGLSKPIQPVILQALTKLQNGKGTEGVQAFRSNSGQQQRALTFFDDFGNLELRNFNDEDIIDDVLFNEESLASLQNNEHNLEYRNVGRSARKQHNQQSTRNLSQRPETAAPFVTTPKKLQVEEQNLVSPSPRPTPRSIQNSQYHSTPQSVIKSTPFPANERVKADRSISFRHYVNDDSLIKDGVIPDYDVNLSPLNNKQHNPINVAYNSVSNKRVYDNIYVTPRPYMNNQQNYLGLVNYDPLGVPGNIYSPIGHTVTPAPFIQSTFGPIVNPVYAYPTTRKQEFRNYVKHKPITAPPDLVPDRPSRARNYEKHVDKSEITLIKQELGYDLPESNFFAHPLQYSPEFIYPTPIPVSPSPYPTPLSINHPSLSLNHPQPHFYPSPSPGPYIVPQYSFNGQGPAYELDYDSTEGFPDIQSDYDQYNGKLNQHIIKTRSPNILESPKLKRSQSDGFVSEIEGPAIQPKRIYAYSTIKPSQKNDEIKEQFVSTTPSTHIGYTPKSTFRKSNRSRNGRHRSLLRSRLTARSREKTNTTKPLRPKNITFHTTTPSTNDISNRYKAASFKPSTTKQPISIAPKKASKPDFSIPSPALSGLPFYISGHEGLGPFVIKSFE